MKFTRYIAVAAFVGCASSSWGEIATAATIALNPVSDAFVSSANPTSNYGGAGALEVSAAGLLNGEFDSLLQFNLATAKTNFDATFGAGNWVVHSETLQLTATVPNNSIFNTSAAGQFAVTWMQNDGWTEGTGTPMSPTTTGITFNTLPSFLSVVNDQAAGAFSFSGSTSATASYTLTLGSGLSGDVTTGTATSLLLKASDSAMSGLFNSRSIMAMSSKPFLTIDAEAVPEPASWIMAVVGISGMMLLRGRFGGRLGLSRTKWIAL